VHQQSRRCHRAFVSVRRVIFSDTARDHDRFVVAADDSVRFHLEGAEVACEIGRPNSLLNEAAPIGPRA